MRRTTKQISELYKGRLDYFRRPHYLRRLRLWAFLIVVVGSLGLAFGYYRFFGDKQEFFNTGPISANHAKFADRCEVCHVDAQPDLAKVTKLDRAVEHLRNGNLNALPAKAGELAQWVQASATGFAGVLPHALSADAVNNALIDLSKKYAATAELSNMDRACLTCHDGYSLHQPQLAALHLRPVSKELSLVHATGCAVCHREHAGPHKMKLPTGESCESCHNQPQQLTKTLDLLKVPGQFASNTPQIRDLGDGVRQFIPPREVPHQPVAFKTFAEGHPQFGYEKIGLRGDPAAIKYNHWRHEQSDIPMMNGKRLDCSDCHQTGANSTFFQPVSYDRHCAACHSLQFDPDIPELTIPHRDPEKVWAYLRSLGTQYYDYGIRVRGLRTREQLEPFVFGQLAKLNARGIGNAEELDRRVFFTGDPPETDRVSIRSNKGQYFAGCAKCHEVTPPAVSGAPKVAPTNMANRWLTRGPFTHAEHTHMKCVDCHGAAKESKLTTDILMPKKESCAECHRPLEGEKVQPLKTSAPEELVVKQRREGGIAADCQSCHIFHAPSEARAVLVTAKP